MIVALAGHVDHGKTSIVRALTGIDTDRLAEEKRRGLTIDLGFAYTNIGRQRIGFVDVPGHHRFVHNMVAGIAGRQYALLVIAADDGVMPQSREHLQILNLLGLQRGVIALNKADRATPSRLAAVSDDIRALTGGSFLEDAEIIALSCETGAGLSALRDHLGRAAGALAANAEDEAVEGGFRLAIDRAFTLRGSGVVVTGTVQDGRVAVGERLALASSGELVRVRGLRVQDAAAESARSGDRAAVNLAGVESAKVIRGDWLLEPALRFPADHFAMRLEVVDDFPRPVKHNAPVHVYHAASHSQGRLLHIDSAPLTPGGCAIVDVSCARALHVKVGDRAILRDHDLERTLGGGTVIDLAVAARQRGEARRRALAAIQPRAPRQTLVASSKRAPVHAATFGAHWNLPQAAVAHLGDDAALLALDGHLLHEELVGAARDHILAALEVHHSREPHSAGLAAGEIGGLEVRAKQLVLASMAAAGELRFENGRYALATHRAAIPPDVERLFGLVQASLDSAQPPSLGDIAKRLKRPFAAFEREMRSLPAFGLAVRISDNRYYLPAQLQALAAVAERLAAQGPFTVRQFRDASGVGRNVVIEVLEHFDAHGYTRREGDTRRVVGDQAAVV